MNNTRSLFPPLFHETDSGGGGGGGSSEHVQVAELPEASFGEKNKIYQYIGSTTETLTNGYFYKCEESTTYDWEETTETETYTDVETLPTASAETIGTVYKYDGKYYATVIVLSYSWINIDVMDVPTPTQEGITISETETKIGTYGGSDLYAIKIPDSKITKRTLDTVGGMLVTSADTPTIGILVDSVMYVEISAYKYAFAGGVCVNKSNGALYWNGYINTSISSTNIISNEIVLLYTK